MWCTHLILLRVPSSSFFSHQEEFLNRLVVMELSYGICLVLCGVNLLLAVTFLHGMNELTGSYLIRLILFFLIGYATRSRLPTT